MLSSADSNDGLYCFFFRAGAFGLPWDSLHGSRSRLARPPTWRTVSCLALPGSYTRYRSVQGRALWDPLRGSSGFRPDHDLAASMSFDVSRYLAGWTLAATLSPLHPATCRWFRFKSSAMAFRHRCFHSVCRTNHGMSDLLPCEQFDTTPGGPEVQAGANAGGIRERTPPHALGRATALIPPKKPSGHLPSPERWPSAPNGQTLASRMAPSCGRLSEGAGSGMGPVRRGTAPLAGCVTIPNSEHPSLRASRGEGS
jgi:hypothetical protein